MSGRRSSSVLQSILIEGITNLIHVWASVAIGRNNRNIPITTHENMLVGQILDVEPVMRCNLGLNRPAKLR